MYDVMQAMKRIFNVSEVENTQSTHSRKYICTHAHACKDDEQGGDFLMEKVPQNQTTSISARKAETAA